MRARTLLSLPLFLLGLACAEESPEHPSEHTATATGALTIDPMPALDIVATGVDGLVIGSVVDATRLSNGSIAVADRADSRILFLDSSGRFVRESGHRGKGPGEYTSLASIQQCSRDTLFVWDRMQGQMVVLDSAGELVRQYRPRGNPDDVVCSLHGDFALTTLVSRHAPSARAPLARGIVDLTNARGDSVGSLGEIGLGESRPLGSVTKIAMSHERVYVGAGDAALVAAYSLAGEPLDTFRLGRARRAPSESNYEAAIEELVTSLRSESDREPAREYLRKIPMPEYLPAYRNLLTDTSGALYAVTSALGDGVTEIQVVDPNGKRIGELRLPVDVTVFEVGTDYILGATEDPKGEEHILLYHIARKP